MTSVTIFGDMLRYNAEFGRATQGEGGVACSAASTILRPAPGPTAHARRHRRIRGAELSPAARAQPRRRRREWSILERESVQPAEGATFTTCEPGPRGLGSRGSEIELDYEEEEGTALNPRLRFYDVPILSPPWIRPFRSGTGAAAACSRLLLADLAARPRVRRAHLLEHRARARPHPHAGAHEQARPAGQGPGPLSEPNYTGELQPEVPARGPRVRRQPHRRVAPARPSFAPSFTGNLDYNRVSDDRYFADLASQVRQVSIGNLPQDGYVTYAAASAATPTPRRRGCRSSRPCRIRSRRSTRPTTAAAVAQRREPEQPRRRFDSALPAELVRFTHDTKVEGTRLAINPVRQDAGSLAGVVRQARGRAARR